MTSEEHLLTRYENHISFRAQVTNRNDPKVCYQAMGVITVGILPLEVVAMYGGNIIGVLISSLWLGICMATLQWLQVRMVKNVYPELYISRWRWDRQGFITIQCQLLEAYFKERNIGKNGEAELKRIVEKSREKKSPVVISVLVTLFTGLCGSWYQIVSAHAKGYIKIEAAVLIIFVLLSSALGILAYYSNSLMEMTTSKKRNRSQVTDLMSELVIRSGK